MTARTRTIAAGAAIASALALLVTACGGSSAESAVSTAAGSSTEVASEAASETSTGEPFVIGAALGLTGDCAPGDAPALGGIEWQVAQLNANGGILGHPVELVTKDMQSEPAQASRVAQELLDEGAQVILGPCLGGNAIPTAETAAAAGVPTILVTNTVPLPSEVMDSGLVFFAGFSDNVQAAASAEVALQEGFRTTALVVSKDFSYTSDTPRWFGEAFEHGGGKVIATIDYSIGQTDFATQVTKLAGLDPQPDVIYSAMFMPDLGIFIPQLRAAGVTAPVFGADAFESEDFLEVAQDSAEGIILTTHGLDRPGTPFAELIDGVTEMTGDAPEANGYAALGGDAVLLVARAAETAGSADPAEIARAISSFEHVQVVSGERTYKGTNGAPVFPITLAEVRDGAYAFLEDVTPSWVPPTG